MRIVVLGTGPFAVPTCRRLLAEGHDIPLAVTRPVADPQAKKQAPRPVFAWATNAAIEVFEPASINTAEAIARLASCAADLLFVCDYGQILSKACLSAARLGGINLHGSILPRHRGAAPVQWTLLSGDDEAGVTVIHMTPRLDAGPALAVTRTKVEPDETAADLEPRLAELGVEATLQAIDILSQWDGLSSIGQIQDNSMATKAPRFSKADGQLDFRRPAEDLVRLVRACQPWPGTYAELQWPDGRKLRLIVRAARATTATVEKLAGAPAGTAIEIEADDLGNTWHAPWNKLLAVATGAGIFLIARIQPASKREMDAAEFLRGHPIEDTARFVLPLATNP